MFDSCSQVCSVEDIQGQEYRAVFVSVTRSEAKNLHHDTQYGIGFLGFPRRLNTAISRSRALLVLVCDPDIVNADPSLKALVDICNSKGDGLILLNLFGKSNLYCRQLRWLGGVDSRSVCRYNPSIFAFAWSGFSQKCIRRCC